jgi:hypothetical protein
MVDVGSVSTACRWCMGVDMLPLIHSSLLMWFIGFMINLVWEARRANCG